MVDRHSAIVGRNGTATRNNRGRCARSAEVATSAGESRSFRPEPHGDLHIGNLRTALAAWLFARSSGGEFLLRFEDLDTATARREHEDGQRRDLERLGFDWDGEPVRQSERMDRYEDALSDLGAAGLTYRCWCSREIREAVSAPHLPPALPRHMSRSHGGADRRAGGIGKPPAVRLRTEQPSVTIVDRLHGEHTEVVDDVVPGAATAPPPTTLSWSSMTARSVSKRSCGPTTCCRRLSSRPPRRHARHPPADMGPRASGSRHRW